MAPNPNPYSPPVTDAPAAARQVVLDGPMPRTVIAVVAIVVLFILVTFYGVIADRITGVYQLTILFLVLGGLFRRSALAWQWGRLVPLLPILIGSISLFYALSRLAIFEILLALALIAPNIAIMVLLTRNSARQYFGLVCPECGHAKARAGDFVFKMRRCPRCDTRWEPAKTG